MGYSTSKFTHSLLRDVITYPGVDLNNTIFVKLPLNLEYGEPILKVLCLCNYLCMTKIDIGLSYRACWHVGNTHYSDVITSTMAFQITRLTIVYATVYSGRKHQSSASLAVVWGIHRWPVNSLYKGPVTWKMFPFDDVIMYYQCSMRLWVCSFGWGTHYKLGNYEYVALILDTICISSTQWLRTKYYYFQFF